MLPTVKQRGTLPVAVTKVQHDGERVVPLGARDEEVDEEVEEEVEEEAFAAARRTQGERVPDVLDVQVVPKWRVVRRFEPRERRTQQRRAGSTTTGRRAADSNCWTRRGQRPS